MDASFVRRGFATQASREDVVSTISKAAQQVVGDWQREAPHGVDLTAIQRPRTNRAAPQGVVHAYRKPRDSLSLCRALTLDADAVVIKGQGLDGSSVRGLVVALALPAIGCGEPDTLLTPRSKPEHSCEEPKVERD